MRLVLTLVVAAHGIGHVLYLLPLLGLANWGQSTRSWLLSNRLGITLTGVIGGLLWIFATTGFTAAALGIYAQTPWWRTLVILSACASLVGLVLFWSPGAKSSPLASLVFDVLLLVALLLLHWPPTEVLVG